VALNAVLLTRMNNMVHLLLATPLSKQFYRDIRGATTLRLAPLPHSRWCATYPVRYRWRGSCKTHDATSPGALRDTRGALVCVVYLERRGWFVRAA